jgi:hypothetical protein
MIGKRSNGCIWIAILALWMSASGRESTSSGRLHQSSLIWTWKENLKLIDHRTSSERVAETSGRMQAGIEASRYSGGSGQNPHRPDEWCLVCRVSGRNGMSSRRLELWIDERPDGMASRPDSCQGTDFSWLANSAETLEHFWIAKSLLKNIFTYKWFCPIRMRLITN